MIFLYSQHRARSIEELFQGTIDGVALDSREAGKRFLTQDVSGVILAQNHQSGVAEPTQADRAIRAKLKQVLESMCVVWTILLWVLTKLFR